MHSFHKPAARLVLLSAALGIAVCDRATAVEWPQWRGPDGQGHAAAVHDLPVTWSETENIAWKTPLVGRAWSSPVIDGNQVWMTNAIESVASEAEKKKWQEANTGKQPLNISGPVSLHALCVDRDSGKLLHDIELIVADNPQPIHSLNSFASPSPVLAAGRLYCHFGDFGTACVDTRAAKVVWTNRDQRLNHENGPGSTPLLWKDKLIFHCDGSDTQSIVALEAATGAVAWKTPRSGELRSDPQLKKAYGTPLVLSLGGRDVLLSPAADWLYGYDPATGKELWKMSYGVLGFSIVPRPVTAHGLLYLSTSFMQPELLAVKLGDAAAAPSIAWREKKGAPNMSSPLVVGDELYMVSDKGVATCLDAKTGVPVWSERLGGNFSSSPLLADGRIYVGNRDGATFVIKPGRTFALEATNQLEGQIMATPAAVDRAIYLRTDKAVYRIEKRQPPAAATASPVTARTVAFQAPAAAPPASPPAADAPPEGEVFSFTFDTSTIFPGTTREVSVYVPRQYDGKTPACVHVNQDGIQFNAPAVFDRLIAEKKIPVMIGVFVKPGVVPAATDKALARFNRSFEYDGLGPEYARFLLEEILPAVETRKTADGRPLVLSKNGNDRSIGGTSSGAIAAFTAAWERPDAFSRVYSGIGTYVGLRGGHAYSTLVRKFEPKPLRIFLEDGSNDLNIYAGDWWMANQAMQRSLAFAGYDSRHAWGDGGHNNKQATELFPEAFAWLWGEWPQPIAKGAGSPQLQEILIPGEDWRLVGEGYRFTEGPAANAKGDLFFNDVGDGKTYRITPDWKADVWLADSHRGDGQNFHPDGRLVAASGGDVAILAWDTARQPTKLAEGWRGNDVVVNAAGMVYVTEPGWDGKSPSKIHCLKPAGGGTYTDTVVDTGLKFSNGLCLSPDQSLLYVADSRSHWVWSYQVNGDGTLVNKQRFYHLHVPDTADDSGADGMRVDRDGRLWVATKMGIQVCDQAGRVNCIIPTPNGKISNLCFGGPDFATLLATCGDKVYMRRVKAAGSPNFLPPTIPAKPKL
jgi:sugar lactone lactonase YvrE/outer membrane protein assembly factor BamB/enterochelin esterase-like enzyme